MGDGWGVNRSVSQIHGLLYLAEAPMTAEDIADTLGMAHLCCELFYRARVAQLVRGNRCRVPISLTQLGETLGMDKPHPFARTTVRRVKRDTGPRRTAVTNRPPGTTRPKSR